VLARVPSQQHRELIFRAFSYNTGRLETLFLLFIEDFYKALVGESFYSCSDDALAGGKWRK
jgi:hypothetical protein